MPGNQNAVTHGAHAPAIVAINTPPVVAELMEAISVSVPFLTAADEVLVERLARIVVRLRLMDQYLDRLGGSMIDSRGRPRGCWRLQAALEHQFRETCKLLGLGPAVRAQLMASLGSAQADAERARMAKERLRERYAAQTSSAPPDGRLGDSVASSE